MSELIIVGLLQNIAILLAFSMLYDYVWVKAEENKSILTKVITGIVLGFIGIVLMLTPWTLYPGVVFDTRSIMLAVSGLFFGGIPTAVAILLTSAYRIFMGGDGMLMGIAVILTSGIIGIVWGKLSNEKIHQATTALLPWICSTHNHVALYFISSFGQSIGHFKNNCHSGNGVISLRYHVVGAYISKTKTKLDK